MMVDPAALREALDRRDEWLRRPETVPMYSVVIEAAAWEFLRLMETAETVWWCEVHHSESLNSLDSAEDQIGCWLYSGFPEKPHGPCRMVSADLTRRET